MRACRAAADDKYLKQISNTEMKELTAANISYSTQLQIEHRRKGKDRAGVLLRQDWQKTRRHRAEILTEGRILRREQVEEVGGKVRFLRGGDCCMYCISSACCSTKS
jgi:hypothetical protein